MPIDRTVWAESVTESTFPSWGCPNCGHTISLTTDGIVAQETGASLSCHESEAWEPEWTQGRFTAQFECAQCKDPATGIGTYEFREQYDPQYRNMEYYSVYRIAAIEPAPVLISLPRDLPEALVVQLDRAFRLFWIDSAACANAIRGVVEEFLNHSRVHKTDGSRSRKGRLSLHRRIELFATKDAHLSSALMAMKWIGNAGSHSAGVPRASLFDGFDLLEHVLHETFEAPRKRVAQLAKGINRRRGP